MSREEERRVDLDEKKRKRMLSNRESARRSRMKKHEQLNDLLNRMGEIREENRRILEMVKVRSDWCAKIEAENRVMRAQVMELKERLRFFEVMEICHPLLIPLQPSCPVQSIMAFGNVFQC